MSTYRANRRSLIRQQSRARALRRAWPNVHLTDLQNFLSCVTNPDEMLYFHSTPDGLPSVAVPSQALLRRTVLGIPVWEHPFTIQGLDNLDLEGLPPPPQLVRSSGAQPARHQDILRPRPVRSGERVPRSSEEPILHRLYGIGPAFT